MRVALVLTELAVATTLFAISCHTGQEVPPIRSLPLADAKVIGGPELAQGNVWLHWSADHQLGYVQGWADGGYWEYFRACTEAQIAAPSIPTLQDTCMEHVPATRLASEAYQAKVTEFYLKYPADRALPIRRVLRKFLEPGMTAEGIHKWLDELIESMRHSSAK